MRKPCRCTVKKVISLDKEHFFQWRPYFMVNHVFFFLIYRQVSITNYEPQKIIILYYRLKTNEYEMYEIYYFVKIDIIGIQFKSAEHVKVRFCYSGKKN